MPTYSPTYLHAISTHSPPYIMVEEGWRKGGETVEKGWTTLKL